MLQADTRRVVGKPPTSPKSINEKPSGKATVFHNNKERCIESSSGEDEDGNY